MSDVTAAVLGELRNVISQAIAGHSQGDLFDGLSELLARDGHMRAVDGISHPVAEQWLRTAIDDAPGKWRALAELLGGAAPEIPWLTSYSSLESTPELEAFRAHYCYQVFVGPVFRGYEPPVLMDELLVGFSLQAPNIFYPQHHHEPPEIYGVISGQLEWQVGDTWSTVGPGDVIVHRPHESHAMRTSDAPALTWVAWPRNPHTSVYMPSMDPPAATMAPLNYS